MSSPPPTRSAPPPRPEAPAERAGTNADAAARGDNPKADAARDAADRSPDADVTVPGWTRGDAWFALLAGGLILTLMLVHWARLQWRGAPAVEIERLDRAANRFQLDVNEATWVEWMQLDGVGETLARRIVADREENGPFPDVDAIQRVHGIGPKTVEELRPWLRCAEFPPPPAGNDGSPP